MLTNLEQGFLAEFGHKPEAIIQSPGRINLIGEHVDYLDGLVLPLTIDRYIYAGIAANGEDVIRIKTDFSKGAYAEISVHHQNNETGDRSWLNYIIGVLRSFSRNEVKIPGFNMYLSSTLPSGAGLSSSAALTTATSMALEILTKTSISPVSRALNCQKVEHEFAGVPCGIMDPLVISASLEGQALLIDCSNLELTYLPFPEGVSVVVADTMVQHSLADGEYRKRRGECEMAAKVLKVLSLRKATLAQVESQKHLLGNKLYRRARHAVSEMQRVGEFAEALKNRNFEVIGQKMRQSHESLRDDFEVSCPELDALAEAAWEWGLERGLIGSRMTGAGFGGSTVSLVATASVNPFMEHLCQRYHAAFGEELQPFVTSPGTEAKIHRL